MIKRLRQVVSLLLVVLLLYEQSAHGQLILPNPDIYFSPVLFSVDKFRPVHLRYLDAGSPDGAMRFLLDKGDLKTASNGETEASSKALIDYFLIGLSLTDDSFWVNLRPDAPDNMIDSELEKTDVGRILLEADLNLKKDMARLTSPRTPQGRAYWDRLYAKAQELFGTEQIELPAYTRPWIVPGEIIVRQSGWGAYIYKADLKVMLEEDYLRGSQAYVTGDGRLSELNEYSSALLRDLVIPQLAREVNGGRRYAALRQVYYSLIFARWLKEQYKKCASVPYKSDVASDALPVILNRCSRRINTGDLTGLTSVEHWDKNSFFRQYRRSFSKGEYNESEAVNTPCGQTIRQYVSGGINFSLSPWAGTAGMNMVVVNTAAGLPSLPYNAGIILDGDGNVAVAWDTGSGKDGGDGSKDGESVLRVLLDKGKGLWSYEAVSALRNVNDPDLIKKAGMDGLRLINDHVLPGETVMADYTGKAVMGELRPEGTAPLHFMVYFDDSGGIRNVFIRAHQLNEDSGNLKGIDPLGMGFISIVDQNTVNGMPYLCENDKAAVGIIRDRIMELVRGYKDGDGFIADKRGDYQILRPIVHDDFSREHILNVLAGYPGLEYLRNFMVKMDFPIPKDMVYVNHARGHPYSKGMYGGVFVGRAMFTNDKVFLANTFFHEAAHAIFFYLKCVSGGAVNLGVSRKADKHAAERKVSGDDVVNYFKNSPVHAYLRQDPLYKDYYDARGNIRPEYLNLAVSEAFAYTLEAVLSLSGYNAIRAPVIWGDVEFLVAKGFLPDLFFPEGFLEKYDMPKQTVLSQEFYYALSGYLYAAGRKEEAFALFDRMSVRLPQKAAGYLIFLAKNEGNSVFQTFLERALDKGYLRAKESAAIFLGLPEVLLNIYILSLRSANEESAERVWSLFLREASKTPPALIGMISAGLPYEVNARILSAFIVLSDENQRADAQSGLSREHFADNDDLRPLIIKAIREKSPEPLRLLTNNGRGAAGGKSAAIFRRYFTNDGGSAAAEAGYARPEDKSMPFEEARLYKGLAVERDYRKQAMIAGTLGIVIAPFSEYISDPVAWSYGWDMRMRRVPENKPSLNMGGGKNTDLAGTQPWTGRITDVTGNKFLRNNPYFLALAAKSVPQLPNSGLLSIGGENYNKLSRNSNPLYLMTKDIDHRKDLPAGYATVSGLRKPRITTRHLPSHLSEVPRVELFLPDKDIFLTSNAYNGSQGCVKLGVLATGEPVALKAYFSGDISVKESMDRLLESYRVGQIADDLGIGPRMHGLFEDDIGTLWMVMDIVPGDFAPGAGEFIKAWSIEEFIEINERLEKAGWVTDDFQYYITPNGHVVVIDTYFMAEDILPGIELFSSELAGFLKYAGDDVREQFAGLIRGAVIKDKDGGDADLSIVPATSGINEPAGHLLNQDAKGGIDFRSLPVTAQNADVSVKMILPSRPAAVIPEAELVKEWNVIRDLISSGNIPAAKKIREYWISAGGNGSGEKEKVLRCVMEIMRMEEECAVPCEPGLLELLGALESGV